MRRASRGRAGCTSPCARPTTGLRNTPAASGYGSARPDSFPVVASRPAPRHVIKYIKITGVHTRSHEAGPTVCVILFRYREAVVVASQMNVMYQGSIFIGICIVFIFTILQDKY